LWQLQRRHPADYKILGTDVSEAPLAHAARMGVPVIRDDFLSHNFDQQFDAVMFWAVIEHLFAPDKFLKKAADILKPGGLCFILVPNLNSLAIKLLGAKYRYVFPEHLNYFSPQTLNRFFGREFELESISTTHFNPFVIWQDFWRGERDVPREERARLLKRTNAYKKSPWLWPVKAAYQASEKILGRGLLADNLVAVARKR
jgi:2-polyprenyl-3-methyl-5-hydroxy-6-metoxy-1,4-benzoquinol methylase